MKLLHQHTDFIKSEALRLGFSYCGIARAERLEDDARRLESWLRKGLHGSMQYMEKNFDLRIDPTRLVPSARSVITLLCNYYPASQQQQAAPRISRYAYGKDYHVVIRDKLNTLLAGMRDAIGEVNGRGFVDSAPVLERAWATKSGLGWVGKNGNLINKKSGSFFFIATLITDLPLIYDDPFTLDHCGTCTRCIEACPTQAILPGKVIDGSRCISYYTIELKDALLPGEMKGKFDNWAFGCDTCQDVCPWNRFSQPTEDIAFSPIPEILNLSSAEWEKLSEEQFNKIFRDSALRRTKFTGMMRNIHFVKSNS
jgi:epoxyqueuosine reductase